MGAGSSTVQSPPAIETGSHEDRGLRCFNLPGPIHLPQATGLTLLEQDFKSALARDTERLRRRRIRGAAVRRREDCRSAIPRRYGNYLRTCHWKISSRAAINGITNVNERYRFTNTGNSVMRIVGVSGVAWQDCL